MMADIGWEKFLHLTKNLGKLNNDTGKQVRLRTESAYIKKWNPSMNTKPRRIKNIYTNRYNHNQTHRPPNEIQEKRLQT